MQEIDNFIKKLVDDENILSWLNQNINGFNFNVKYPTTKETSAKIIWEIFKQKYSDGIFRFNNVLMWNAFPFHPYKAGNKNSNRKPYASEMEIGKSFLTELINIFELDKKQIYAIGRTAEKIIAKINNKPLYTVNYIRHPSHGGKNDCQTALMKL